MTKHSKNNTASSIFSYAEYKKLDYGTKKVFALFVRPTAEADLFKVTQKKDIKRQKERLETLKKEAEAEKITVRQAARERVLHEFEKGQLGLATGPSAIGTKAGGDIDAARGQKRKFQFDAENVDSLAEEAEDAAVRQIEKEQALALKHKLPDFWLPSLTPTYSSSGPPQSLLDIKVQTTCRGGNPAHELSLKNLTPVNFTSLPSSSTGSSSKSAESTPTTSKSSEAGDPMCPSCKKQLSNNTLIFLAKPCGHVTCKTCTDTLVRPAKQCIVCDSKLKDKEIMELKREGTGFAGGGLAETSKAGIAFQG
ncbi:hypothetical protein MD484_g659, partial [Candolleomyces efflorescens]